MKELPTELKFSAHPSLKVSWKQVKETFGKDEDITYRIYVPVLPGFAVGCVPGTELAANIFAEAAGHYFKLASEDLNRLEISPGDVALASTLSSFR